MKTQLWQIASTRFYGIPSNMLRKIWEDVMYWYWPLSFTKLDVAASLAKKKRLEVVFENWVS